jgi:hypothetical protein
MQWCARIDLSRTFHLSISSVSQGFSFLCVDGIAAVVDTFGVLLEVWFALGTFCTSRSYR